MSDSACPVEILLVEDNPDDIELTLRALQTKNITNRIHVVRDGEEALEYVFCEKRYAGRDIHHPPKVILLDLKLPKVDGLTVLRHIKGDARTKAIPVVILTSSEEERDVINTYNCGANSYLVKPIEFEQFINAISSLELYWLILNTPPPEGAFNGQ
ncbi:MAG TPA: response regulator [Kiritimatiellia bacterium]|nr:response regulator [Kiritimatiellia bacterium]HNR94661.1 response regulator [Kiritimatiellia bacterium]HNS81628.1 response regulator [Kiritimatiellia bacterium]HQQ03716.1 response regulator [Kiritimatiellia bacterium]